MSEKELEFHRHLKPEVHTDEKEPEAQVSSLALPK